MSRGFDSESTIIKPGGAVAPKAPVLRLNPRRVARSAVATAPIDSWDRGGLGGKSIPPLITAALPLLNLAGRLRGVSEQPNLDALRGKVIQALKLFEQKGLAGSVPPDRVRAASYALCCTIDDIVLNAPWGNYSVWSRQSMVSSLHTDVTGGERFFDLLAQMHKDPGTNRDVLLLMYYCLSIGFEGRMRVHPQGHLEIGRIREGLYRTLRGDPERELSPQWRGVDMRHKPLSTPLILWTALAVATLALLALYFGLSAALDRRSDKTLTALIEAPPNDLPSLRRNEPRPGLSTPVPAIADPSRLILSRALEPEIKQGFCAVDPVEGGSKIGLKNEGLFEVGKADVRPKFAELIDRIGRLMRATAGQVIVIGYTDDTPIHTSKFPSNYYLSVGRADAVAKLLGAQIDPAKIRAEGRGATEPVASNATPEGREKNRRTDIIVLDRKGP